MHVLTTKVMKAGFIDLLLSLLISYLDNMMFCAKANRVRESFMISKLEVSQEITLCSLLFLTFPNNFLD